MDLSCQYFQCGTSLLVCSDRYLGYVVSERSEARALLVVYDDIVFCHWLLVLLWQDALPAPRRTVHHPPERLWIEANVVHTRWADNP